MTYSLIEVDAFVDLPCPYCQQESNLIVVVSFEDGTVQFYGCDWAHISAVGVDEDLVKVCPCDLRNLMSDETTGDLFRGWLRVVRVLGDPPFDDVQTKLKELE